MRFIAVSIGLVLLFSTSLRSLVEAERGTPYVIETVWDRKNVEFVCYIEKNTSEVPVLHWLKSRNITITKNYSDSGIVVCKTSPESFEEVFGVKPRWSYSHQTYTNHPNELVRHWVVDGGFLSKKAKKDLSFMKGLPGKVYSLPADLDALGVEIMELNAPLFRCWD